MSKPKIGIYWCASCGGCEEAVVDLAEDILGVVEAVDIIFWPCAMDFKRGDVEAMEDKSKGHHHVVIDGKAIPAGTVVPKDEKNIHYGDGSTTTMLKLSPGKHTLTLWAR